MRGVCVAEEARAKSAQSGRSDGNPGPPLCPLHECGRLRPPGAAQPDGSRRIRRVENSNRMCRMSRHTAGHRAPQHGAVDALPLPEAPRGKRGRPIATPHVWDRRGGRKRTHGYPLLLLSHQLPD
jgi:hypothetical protein